MSSTSSSAPAYSTRSSGVKRLLAEARELSNPSVASSEGIFAEPLEGNLFEWHFTVRGPKESEFEGGLYHGRILLPAQYPFKAPDIQLTTSSGRFECNKKICLSITGYHEETWQPAWGIRTALVGLVSFFTSEAKGAIGGLDTSLEERKRLAKLSREWKCEGCGRTNREIMPDEPERESTTENDGKAGDEDAGAGESRVNGETGAAIGDSSAASQSTSPEVQPEATEPRTTAEASSSTSTVPSLPPIVVTDRSDPEAAPTPRMSSTLLSRDLTESTISPSTSSSLPSRSPSAQPPASDSAADAHHDSGIAAGTTIVVDPLAAAVAGGSDSPPTVWLDGAIGLVLIAIASLLCRKML